MTRLGAVLTIVAAFLCFARAGHGQERPAPLTLAVVIPVTSPPLFSPDGKTAADAEKRVTAIANMLRTLIRPELLDVPFALAPSAVFCDEIQQMRGEPASAVTTVLRELAARVPILSPPYADVRLASLASTSAIVREIADGRTRLGACLGAAPAAVLAPPDLSLDGRVIDAAAQTRLSAVLASTGDVPQRPVRRQNVTLIPTRTVADGDAPNDAFLHLEAFEAAAALVPLARADLVTFLTALANDPRITMSTPSQIAAGAPSRVVSLPAAARPPSSYRRALSGAEAAIARFREYTLSANHLAAILRTSLARARSSAEWDGRWSIGRSRARRIVEEVDRQQRLVSGSGGSVTFTSQRGSVPVTVSNAASYPVRVRIRLSSPKLRFPEGSVRDVTIDPPGDTVLFSSLARSTGTFPVQILVASPDGGTRFHIGEVTVRSTAANVPALALTVGGAVFLVAWYARDLRRRRRERRAVG